MNIFLASTDNTCYNLTGIQVLCLSIDFFTNHPGGEPEVWYISAMAVAFLTTSFAISLKDDSTSLRF
jgi:hypothetical protein